jgi:hypothetical protein
MQLIGFKNGNAKLLPTPWAEVSSSLIESTPNRMAEQPEGFDAVVENEEFYGFTKFLDAHGYFWHRVTSFEETEQCLGIYADYDSLLRREVER